MTDEPRKKSGPKPIYSQNHCEELVELMTQGWLDCQIFAYWGISKETFYAWKREHPEFLEAYERAFPACEAYHVNKLKQMQDGTLEGKHSFTATIALLNNKFHWRDQANPGTQNNSITINKITMLQNKNSTELLESIRTNTELLQDAGILDVEYKVLDDKSNKE